MRVTILLTASILAILLCLVSCGDGPTEDEIPTPTGSIEPLPLSEVTYWAYQIQDISEPGAVDKLADSRYDMLVLEPTRTDWASDERLRSLLYQEVAVEVDYHTSS